MLGILVVGAVGNIREPLERKNGTLLPVLYLNPALEHISSHSLSLTLPSIPNVKFTLLSIGPNP